jgi:hypothetical protein
MNRRPSKPREKREDINVHINSNGANNNYDENNDDVYNNSNNSNK